VLKSKRNGIIQLIDFSANRDDINNYHLSSFNLPAHQVRVCAVVFSCKEDLICFSRWASRCDRFPQRRADSVGLNSSAIIFIRQELSAVFAFGRSLADSAVARMPYSAVTTSRLTCMPANVAHRRERNTKPAHFGKPARDKRGNGIITIPRLR